MDADPVPVAHFAGARIDATDRGLWKRLDPFLPPEFANRDVVEQALLQELPNMFAEFNGGASASPAQTVFGNELAAIVADFTADPGRLVLELRPAAPVVLSEDLVEAPQRLFEALAPSVGTAPQDQPEEITGDDLARIEGALEADDLAADERLRFAAAFLGGRGIPRNPVMAVDLLLPLIEVGDSEALALSLGLLDRMEPHLAYWIALHAAAEGHSAALATLDRLEREMPLLDVIELQAERAEADGLMEPGSRGALREAAFAALTGLGQPRSYREAYALALISVAGGDSGAEAVLDEIDTRARRAGEDDRAIWASLIEEATDMATAAWLTGAGR